jgi:hypothetical protein
MPRYRRRSYGWGRRGYGGRRRYRWRRSRSSDSLSGIGILVALYLWSKFGSVVLWVAVGIGVLVLAYFLWDRLAPSAEAVQHDDEPDQPVPRERLSPVAAGREGEQEVQYALKWLGPEYRVIHDVILKGAKLDGQQFDHIVVGPPGVISLETKNYSGTLRIDQYGVWTQQTRGEARRIDSPVFQVQRHRAVLQEILQGQAPIHDFIVLANSRVVIEGREHSAVPIVTADTLLQAVQSLGTNQVLAADQVELVYQRLLSHVSPGR